MSNTKQKIVEALEGIKEYELVWTEEVTYSKNVKAKSEEEAREMFNDGEIDVKDGDITDGYYCEDSLEIFEV